MERMVPSARGRPDETRRRLVEPMFAEDDPRRAWLDQTLLRPTQVALLLQVSRRTVALWASQGRIPSITTPGGHRRFRAADIKALIDRLSRGSRLDFAL